MIFYTWWDALKDFLGALGPILIAIPWFIDFSLKLSKKGIDDVKTSNQKLTEFKIKASSFIKEEIENPRKTDFVWTVTGLMCIFLSFMIALVRGLRDLL